ncbi:hypothetical protein COT99_00790 [Candidatus Falkowbacteria bacterium CG10_big_fil_rev_8_21_14_0_10_43_10]|uniref:DUF4870 domain-containing protein n=1 Tax=Candidatus Falkowbacteria bacterium CG10_big_fil_rev_8_21_14_0_10_43_10 TaxID=1974567 RepID=A0A2H0V2X1_9BACT|nr:MAG: hypothetical protein COT99_00790 [Candidatus Falkowbacteria bacterium CG10_big_fil_rev_8_21_14_0_10_43_10]
MPKAKSTKKSSAETAPEKKFDGKDAEDNKIIASLSYIFILCLVPLLLKRNSEFAQFHARQGLTITVAWFVSWVIGIIPIFIIFTFFINIALLIISILGVIKTLNGESWKIPLIYEWSKKWNL